MGERFGLLALDLATKLGWAVERAEAPPLLGSVTLAKGPHPGTRMADYVDWLSGFIKVNRPERILYEAPFYTVGAEGNARTLETLVTMAGVTDLLAYRFSLPVSKLASNSARKHFCGTGRAKKEDVMAECRRRGWTPENFDESDAACLLDAGIAMYFAARYRRSYPGVRAA